MTNEDDEKVIRRVHPSVAFTITKSQNAWIEEKAKERRLSKSKFLRNLLKDAMERETAAA